MDGLALTIGSGAIGAICGVIGSWIKARYSKTTVEPNPLCVEESAYQQRVKDCKDIHSNLQSRVRDLEKRISKIEGEIPHINQSLYRIESKLDTVLMRSNHP